MEVPYSRQQLIDATAEVYPFVPTAHGHATSARSSSAVTARSESIRSAVPIEVYIANFPWGKYLATGEERVDVCISSWTRLAPNTHAGDGESGRQLHELPADEDGSIINGYTEGIALDATGYVSEGSGENLFPRLPGQAVDAADRQLRACRGSPGLR